MNKLSKILSIVLYALLAITLVMAGFFYFGGELEGEAYFTPAYTGMFLNWGKLLVIVTSVIALAAEVILIVINPKNALRSLLSFGFLVVVSLISYGLADGSPLVLPGYNGPDNVPSMLVMTDVFLYVTYILGGAVVATIFAGEFSRFFR